MRPKQGSFRETILAHNLEVEDFRRGTITSNLSITKVTLVHFFRKNFGFLMRFIQVIVITIIRVVARLPRVLI